MQQPGETMAERKARLKALRQAKDAAEGAPEEKKDGDEEPVLKFRNYLPKDEVLSEGLIKATRAPEFEPVVAKPLPVADADVASGACKVRVPPSTPNGLESVQFLLMTWYWRASLASVTARAPRHCLHAASEPRSEVAGVPIALDASPTALDAKAHPTSIVA